VREKYTYMCIYVCVYTYVCICRNDCNYVRMCEADVSINMLKEYDLYIHNQREELRAITINIHFDAITFNYRRRYVFAQIVISFIYFNEVFYMDENYYDKYTKLYFC